MNTNIKKTLDRFKFAAKAGGFGVWEYNFRTDELIWDESQFDLYEISKDDFTGDFDAWRKTVHPDDIEQASKKLEYAIESKTDLDVCFRIITSNKSIKYIKAKGKIVFDENNQPIQVFGLNKDVTEEKLFEIKEERYRQLLIKTHEIAGVGGWEYDILEDKLSWTNLTYDIHQLPVGSRLSVESAIAYYTERCRPIIKDAVESAIKNGGGWNLELEIITAKGKQIWVRAIGEAEKIDGKIVRLIGTFQDITNSKHTADRLLYLAERDPLTNLFNRSYFNKQLKNKILISKREKKRFSLFYFDLDEFKSINDSLGHSIGDEVLVRAAKEFLKHIREGEVLARLGGDEFCLLTSVETEENAFKLSERIIASISQIPFILGEKKIQLTTSIGIAFYPEHGDSAEELMVKADQAMYTSKFKGKSIASIYDPSSSNVKEGLDKLNWNQRINQALKQDLFELHFQGIYETDRLRPVYAEALVRMIDSDKNLIMPNDFIPIAETSGAIIKIDRWVCFKCIDLLEQNQMHSLSVNLSAKTIAEGSLADEIIDKLKNSTVEPKRLIFEITETSSITNIDEANYFFKKLSTLGCRVCLDDFGSGFATFSYLKSLHVDTVKIDGDFIVNLPSSHENQVFVKAMLEVANSLNIDCVAEFVEDLETLTILQNIGVKYVQGYYLGKPSPQNEDLLDCTNQFIINKSLFNPK